MLRILLGHKSNSTESGVDCLYVGHSGEALEKARLAVKPDTYEYTEEFSAPVGVRRGAPKTPTKAEMEAIKIADARRAKTAKARKDAASRLAESAKTPKTAQQTKAEQERIAAEKKAEDAKVEREKNEAIRARQKAANDEVRKRLKQEQDKQKKAETAT